MVRTESQYTVLYTLLQELVVVVVVISYNILQDLEEQKRTKYK